MSIAMAYNMRRKPKKMATGGVFDNVHDAYQKVSAKQGLEEMDEPQKAMEPGEDDVADFRDEMTPAEMQEGEAMMRQAKGYAMGGDVVDRILAKKYSEGGRVANGGEDDFEKMADSLPNEFDDLALDDSLESTNSGAADGDFLGDSQEDQDRSDIVARIMKKRMRQHNPVPA